MTSQRSRNTTPGIPPTPLIKSVRALRGRETAVTAERMLTPKSAPRPENAERKTHRMGFPVLEDTARIITADIINKVKNM